MMKEYALPNSKQIPNCFSASAKEDLSRAVKELTVTASEAGTTELKNFPNYFIS